MVGVKEIKMTSQITEVEFLNGLLKMNYILLFNLDDDSSSNTQTQPFSTRLFPRGLRRNFQTND